MADIPLTVAGDDSFIGGMNGFLSPTKLPPSQYVMGMNVINRGGVVQTRPGSKSLFDMPEGNLQGCTLFQPSTGLPVLVFAVDGTIYVSYSPYRTYEALPNIKFSKYSKYVAWATGIKSTDYTDEGILVNINPVSVLIMQDGLTRAAFWDGSTSRHLNPTPSGQELTLPGFDETPVGLWMAWSNNRLWVSRGSQVFASDIGNPLKFTETQYLNEARAFYLPGNCTGIAETPDRSGIICFTPESGVLIQSGIQDRTQWLTTKDFQQTILPNVGCIAPRSIVQQYGLLWWFTSKGLVNQDSAERIYISSRIDTQDNEMIQSKANLSYDLSGVCGAFIENYLFHGVPNGDKINTRLHVLDQAPSENEFNSWPAYWTGWRPVEFARGVVMSKERTFCASYDYDGVNRMWELFTDDKNDNGIPITSFVVTKQHFFENRDYKRFRYAEVEVVNLLGQTAMMVAAAGLKGAFQEVMVKDMVATNGQMYYSSVYGEGHNQIGGSMPQSRILRTEDKSDPSECNSECIESDNRGLIDKAFCLVIAWSGIAGINSYRIFSQFYPQALEGVCQEDETGDRLLNEFGCGSLTKFTSTNPFSQYFATATYTKLNEDGEEVTHTSTQSSVISQLDANRKASKTAEWYVLSEIGELV